jgi:hypothetical protein
MDEGSLAERDYYYSMSLGMIYHRNWLSGSTGVTATIVDTTGMGVGK